LGHEKDPVSPISKGIANFSNLITGKSKDKYNVEAYGMSKLGKGRELLELVKIGMLDLAVIRASILVDAIAEIGVLNLPFLFNSHEEADEFIEGEAGKSILELLSNLDVKGLSYYEDGYVGIASNTKPIRDVLDYKGLKVRINSPQIVSSSLELLGAIPISLRYSEVSMAAQTGVIDATLLGVQNFSRFRYHEAFKHYSLTNQFYVSQILIINKKRFDDMSKGLRQIFTRSALESSYYQKHLSRKMERELLRSMEKKGVEIVRNPNKVAMKKAVSKIYDSLRELWRRINCSKCPLPPWCCK